MSEDMGGQPVTGQTLLWAIVALALTAMTQDSATARRYKFVGISADGSTGPYRFSPLFCIHDIALDLYSIWQLFTRPATCEEPTKPPIIAMATIRALLAAPTENQEDPEVKTIALAKNVYFLAFCDNGATLPAVWKTRGEVIIRLRRWRLFNSSETTRPNMTTAVFSLTCFMLGALPQAIKIFAIQDMFHIQILATIYVLAIVIHAVKSVLQSNVEYEPLKPFNDIPDRFLAITYFKVVLYATYSAYWYRIAQDVLPRSPSPLQAFYQWYKPIRGYCSDTWMLLLLLACAAPRSKMVQGILVLWPIAQLVKMVLEFLLDLFDTSLPIWSETYNRYLEPVLRNGRGGTYGFLLMALPVLVSVGLAQSLQWMVQLVMHERPERDVIQESKDLLAVFPQVAAEYKATIDLYFHGSSYRQKILSHFMTLFKDLIVPGTLLSKVNYSYTGLHPDVQWSSFLLFNILTFTMYFTLCFGDMTSTQPSWTSIFG